MSSTCQVNVLIGLEIRWQLWNLTQTIVQVAHSAVPMPETQLKHKPATLEVLVPPPQPKLGKTGSSDLAIRQGDYLPDASSCT